MAILYSFYTFRTFFILLKGIWEKTEEILGSSRVLVELYYLTHYHLSWDISALLTLIWGTFPPHLLAAGGNNHLCITCVLSMHTPGWVLYCGLVLSKISIFRRQALSAVRHESHSSCQRAMLGAGSVTVTDQSPDSSQMRKPHSGLGPLKPYSMSFVC